MLNSEFLSNNVVDTTNIGCWLAKLLRSGDVLLLSGAMGAGKSELARGIARGLGVLSPVTSPTFTLLNIYRTDLGIPLHHFDWYRAEDGEELLAAGLEEFITGEFITMIEWHERAPELLPEDCLEIIIEALSHNRRKIKLLPRGQFRVFVPSNSSAGS